MSRPAGAPAETLLAGSHLASERTDVQSRVHAALGRHCGPDPALVEDLHRRLAQLAAFHQRSTGADAHFVRTPGRINLIGEHTDYNGLPVLPMTLQRDVLVAWSARNDGRVLLRNLSPDYPPREFTLSASIPPSPAGDWANYVKAAAQAVVAEHGARCTPCGADLSVGGNLPAGAGLSSSSALVVAAALALLYAHGVTFDKRQLAERLAEAEHYVGTRGGGMDQAITLLGEPGHALEIDFFPLSIRTVPLPEDVAVVAAHSLVRAHKTGGQRLNYNLRPLECRLAVALLNRSRPDEAPLVRLGQLEPLMSTDAAVRLIERAIPAESYSLAVLRSALTGREEATLAQAAEFAEAFGLHKDAPSFAPRRRAVHVLREGRRVRDAVRALRRRHHGALGHLLDASDRSCHELYQIGTPELEQLSALGRKHGALGARLTGAGFGGFVISLVPAERVDEFMARLADEYYDGYLARERPDLRAGMGPLCDVLFRAVSTRGGDRLTLA